MPKIKLLISVLIVNFNSSDFVGLSLFSLKYLTKNPFQVFILDNGSKKSDFSKLQTIVSAYKNVFLERRETKERGSMAHGKGLDYLVKKVNTPFFCILDADCVWLKKNWDEILIGKLNKKVKVIGTQAPKPKFQDFPVVFAAIFETRTYLKLDISFTPHGQVSIKNDTSSILRKKYNESFFKGEILYLKNTREFKHGPYRNVICAEFYDNPRGVGGIFASHFGRGSTLGVDKYLKRCGFFSKIPFLPSVMSVIKGMQEQHEWIKISEEIIKKQIKKK